MNIATMSRSLLVAMASAAMVFSWTTDARSDGEFLTPFPPDYPTGSVYTGVRALIIGGPGDNTTRCSADLEAGQLSAVGIAEIAQAAAQLVCDSAAPGSETGACTPVALVNAALAVAEFQAGACALQDGLIDSAEIEAGFENTLKLIDLGTKLYETQLERNLLNCTAVVGFILPEANGGLAEWVAELVQDRIDDYTPVIGDPLRILEAQDRFDQGDIDFLAGNFEEAYSGYCKAYGRLVAGKGRG